MSGCCCGPAWRKPKPNGTCATCGGYLPGEGPPNLVAMWRGESESIQTYVRGVSGWGARCGCGGKSELHIGIGSLEVTADTSTFLCAECVRTAVELLFEQRPEQPPYWPGDEGRDEHYEPPSRGRSEGPPAG